MAKPITLQRGLVVVCLLLYFAFTVYSFIRYHDQALNWLRVNLFR